jgi:uncharacterized alpha-E superfamily protein
MLSRVANSLYWMSRFIERAENVARIADVMHHLTLDLRQSDSGAARNFWLPIVQTMGDEELFFTLYDEADSHSVREFLTFQRENPGSVSNCIAMARENARMVRDQITGEMWEGINSLHLFLQSPSALDRWHAGPVEFYHEMKVSSLYAQGLIDATVPHTAGWLFMQVGRYLERADKTTRILDLRYVALPAKGAPLAPLDPGESLAWSAMLRCCSAWDAYRQLHGADIGPLRVTGFLLLSEDFPRSVEFCVRELDAALRHISGVRPGRFSNHAEKFSGRLLAEIQFSSAEDILDFGLHDYLDMLQRRFNEIGEALFDAYITHLSAEDDYSQSQQQQQ